YFPARAILVRPIARRPRIHGCGFHDNRDGGGDHNAHEAISLGYANPSSRVSMQAKIVGNRLWNLNVEGEGICVKTSDNIIESNEILNSRAAFSLRYGTRNVFLSNTATNSRGFVVADLDNKLIDNKINGRSSIRVRGGNANVMIRQNGP